MGRMTAFEERDKGMFGHILVCVFGFGVSRLVGLVSPAEEAMMMTMIRAGRRTNRFGQDRRWALDGRADVRSLNRWWSMVISSQRCSERRAGMDRFLQD